MRKFFILLLAVLPIAVFSQEKTRTIRGIVKDAATGEELAGATVFIYPDNKGSENYVPQGASTDAEGRFELRLPISVKNVVISYVGYETLTLNISRKEFFEILLKSSSHELEDAVVTGYQRIEKRKATSAIETVKADDIRTIGMAGIDNMLEGKASGVFALPTNGAPGAPNKIRIRSTVSLTGSTDPLWVVDGMILEGNDIPKNFSDKDNIDNLYNTSIAGINPADIKDITILKDAAATAIYGAKAANGVIVVTTRSGSEGAPVIRASAAVFFDLKPDMNKLRLMNASEKIDWELRLAGRKDLNYRSEFGEVARILNRNNAMEIFREQGFNALSPEIRNTIDALREKNTGWGDELYTVGINRQYNLSVSGGGKNVNYYFSAGHYDEKGTTKGTGFDRSNITLKTDWKFTDKLTAGVSLFFSQSKRHSYITDTDALTNPARYSRTVNPYLSIRGEAGNYIYDPDIDGYSGNYIRFNIIEERENTDYRLKNKSIKPIFRLEYKPILQLKLHTHLAFQSENTSTLKEAGENSYFTRKYRMGSGYKKNNEQHYFMPEGGIVQNWETDMSQYQWRLQGEYSGRFDTHEVDIMGGMEIRRDKQKSIHTKGFGFDSKSFTTKPLIIPEGNSSAGEERWRQYRRSFNENRYMSYYMTASYMYANKYTVFGSLRYDGSNLFGVSHKYRYLPLWSISAAWNINREEWLQEAKWMENLKWRISYGIQGNVDKNTSPLVIGGWGNTSVFPGGSLPTITVISPPNRYLKWEKTVNYNTGLDLAIWGNRIRITTDFYKRISSDLIGTRMLPGENGFDFTSMNWAKLTNKGFEFSLSTVNIKHRNFKWTTDFNIARNSSKVNKLNVRDNSYTPSIEGYPVGAMFSLKTSGKLDEKGLPVFVKDEKEIGYYDMFKLNYGMLYGIIPYPKSDLSPAEFRTLFEYAGNSEPKFTGGFINRFYYKNFDLIVSANFILKQTVRETPFYNPVATSPACNLSRRVTEIWGPENSSGTLPGLIGKTTEGSENDENLGYAWMHSLDYGSSFAHYDIWYKTLSYMRISSIRLGYTLPATISKRIGMSSARFNLETRNPFVFSSSYKGYFDPETYGNIYAQPLPKNISFGIELSF